MDEAKVPPGIRARQIRISPTAEISGDIVITGIDGGEADLVVIGSHTRIASGVRAALRTLEVGSWCTLHAPLTMYGHEGIKIGDSTWIGQDVILNCTAPLTIGRGTIISAKSSIWTHFTGGDYIQGCRYHESKAAVIGEDVWLGVGVTLAPIAAGDRSLALAGASVVKDMLPNHVYGGVPAKDLTEKLGPPYLEISHSEKLEKLEGKLEEFKRLLGGSAPNLDFGRIRIALGMGDEVEGVSTFDVSDRTYSNIETPEEIAFMRFLLPHVKFYPRA